MNPQNRYRRSNGNKSLSDGLTNDLKDRSVLVLQIHESENVARSLYKLLVFVALQLLSSYSWNAHSQLYRIPRAATPRGIIRGWIKVKSTGDIILILILSW